MDLFDIKSNNLFIGITVLTVVIIPKKIINEFSQIIFWVLAIEPKTTQMTTKASNTFFKLLPSLFVGRYINELILFLA